jgi:hypothetical protein
MVKKTAKPKVKALTKKQKDTLRKHSVHHSAKHMAEMKRSIKTGVSFSDAHKKAMKKVGK